MGKRRIDQIAGRKPWEIEIGYWNKQGLADPDTVRALVTNLRMLEGDLLPLAAAIRSHLAAKGRRVDELHPAVLEWLALMIERKRLSVKRRGRGNRDPGIFSRDVLMFHLREQGKSEEEIAEKLYMSPDAVHAALIKVRKLRRKGATRW
jgi:hypothetical protein